MSGSVFICYRKDDSRHQARTVYERLEREFSGQMFFDESSILGGDAYEQTIVTRLRASKVVVAVIGAVITTVGYLAEDPVLMTIGGILTGFAGGAAGTLLGGGMAGGVALTGGGCQVRRAGPATSVSGAASAWPRAVAGRVGTRRSSSLSLIHI